MAEVPRDVLGHRLPAWGHPLCFSDAHSAAFLQIEGI